MKIFICNETIKRQAYSAVPNAKIYIDSIQQNFNDLFYMAFKPEADSLSARVNGDKVKLKKEMSRLEFKQMMSEEILNELSNILNDAMQNITEEDSASIGSYLTDVVIPAYVNQYLSGSSSGE